MKRTKTVKSLICAALSIFLFSAPAFSYTFTLAPTEDTFTDSYYVDEVMGSTKPTRLWTGETVNPATDSIDGNYTSRSYLKFDLTGITSIDTADLWLYRVPDIWEYNDPDQGIVRVYYETNNSWSESSLSWSTANVLNWTDNIMGDSVTIGPWTFPNNQGWFSWDVSDFAKLAQNQELSLVLASGGPFHIFYSSEGVADSNTTEEFVTPYLGINTVQSAPIPEPATMTLFGLGLLGLASLRRKKRTG